MSALVETKTTLTVTEHPASVEAMNAQEVMTNLLFEIAVLSSMPETQEDEIYNL